MATQLGWIRKFYKPVAVDSPPLVICPHAGGGASTYRKLSKALSANFDVIAFQYPGRQDRAAEAPLGTIEEIAAGAFAEFVRSPYRGDAPVTVFGHSLGSLVAFEFVRLAEAAGVPVRQLAASGSVPPWRVASLPPHPAEDEQLLDHVAGLNGTGADVLASRELMRMVLPALKADYGAFDAYSCPRDAVLRTGIHAMGGSDDEFVTIAELYGWQEHTGQELQVSMFDGGHFYLHDQVAAVAEALSADVVWHPVPR